MPKKPFTPAEVKAQQIRIMDCASQVMAEIGYHQLSMRKLAKLLNMTASNIYNYFINKEVLFLKTRRRGFELLSEYSQTLEREGPVVQTIQEVSERLVRFGQIKPGYYQLIFQPPQLSNPYSPSIDMKLAMEVECIALAWQNYLTFMLSKNIVGFREATLADKENILIAYFSGIHGLIDSFHHQALPVLKMDDQDKINRLIFNQVQFLIGHLAENIDSNHEVRKDGHFFGSIHKDMA